MVTAHPIRPRPGGDPGPVVMVGKGWFIAEITLLVIMYGVLIGVIITR